VHKKVGADQVPVLLYPTKSFFLRSSPRFLPNLDSWPRNLNPAEHRTVLIIFLFLHGDQTLAIAGDLD